MERGKRPKIELTVTGKLGTMGCHRGHHIGETFDYDTDRGKICPMAMHCAFPYIDILRYGGSFRASRKGKRNSAAPMPTWHWCLRRRLRIEILWLIAIPIRTLETIQSEI